MTEYVDPLVAFVDDMPTRIGKETEPWAPRGPVQTRWHRVVDNGGAMMRLRLHMEAKAHGWDHSTMPWTKSAPVVRA